MHVLPSPGNDWHLVGISKGRFPGARWQRWLPWISEPKWQPVVEFVKVLVCLEPTFQRLERGREKRQWPDINFPFDFLNCWVHINSQLLNRSDLKSFPVIFLAVVHVFSCCFPGRRALCRVFISTLMSNLKQRDGECYSISCPLWRSCSFASLKAEQILRQRAVPVIWMCQRRKMQQHRTRKGLGMNDHPVKSQCFGRL